MSNGGPSHSRESTSRLTTELERILQEEGSLWAPEACRRLLRSRRVAVGLARQILQSLVAGDRRFTCTAEGLVSLAPPPQERSRPLRQNRYCVLDLETTGGSRTRDRILEIGLVEVENGHIGKSFETLVNPGIEVPAFISSMTGIRSETVRDSPLFDQVAGPLLEFVGDSILVAHNLPFDLGFLNQELDRARGFVIKNRVLCTVKLGRRLLPQLPDRRLDTLAYYYGFEFDQRHRALGDAKVTARLLLKFFALLEEQEVTSFSNLEAFLAPASKAKNRQVRVKDRKWSGSRRGGSSPSGES